jgi:hypothetical protein
MLLASHNWAELEVLYRSRAPYSCIVVDDFLSDEYVGTLRNFLAGDGGWTRKNWQVSQLFNRQPPLPDQKRLIDELKSAFHGVIGDLDLVKHWAVACHENQGLHVHADNAEVAVNLWLTPDQYNRTPGGSGLTLYRLKRRPDMMVHEFNAMPWAGEFFQANAPEPLLTVPYRFNRAVIFDAAIFHATDEISFEQGSLVTVRMGLTLAFDTAPDYAGRMSHYT